MTATPGRARGSRPAQDGGPAFPRRSLPGSAGPAPAFQLRTLGRFTLHRADGAELHAPLAQPKRAALLVVLAAGPSTGFHQRAALQALFWPELPAARAAAALRKAVYHLRRDLGPDTVERRGASELRLRPGAVWCDAAAFRSALAAGDPGGAALLYGGPLLPAFHVRGAAGFERWLEEERGALGRAAFEAARAMVNEEEHRQNRFAAALWARRAVELAPLDEAGIRALMSTLHRAGDRAGALEAHAAFTRRLRAELELDPTPETEWLARAIRDQTTPWSGEAP